MRTRRVTPFCFYAETQSCAIAGNLAIVFVVHRQAELHHTAVTTALCAVQFSFDSHVHHVCCPRYQRLFRAARLAQRRSPHNNPSCFRPSLSWVSMGAIMITVTVCQDAAGAVVRQRRMYGTMPCRRLACASSSGPTSVRTGYSSPGHPRLKTGQVVWKEVHEPSR